MGRIRWLAALIHWLITSAVDTDSRSRPHALLTCKFVSSHGVGAVEVAE